jgi:hypothetical protein
MWQQSVIENDQERRVTEALQHELDEVSISRLVKWCQYHARDLQMSVIASTVRDELHYLTQDRHRTNYLFHVFVNHNFGVIRQCPILDNLELFDASDFWYPKRDAPIADFREQSMNYWCKIAHSTVNLHAVAVSMQTSLRMVAVSALWAAFARNEMTGLHAKVISLCDFLEHTAPDRYGTVLVENVLYEPSDQEWWENFGYGPISHLEKPSLLLQTAASLTPVTLEDASYYFHINWHAFGVRYFRSNFLSNLFQLYAALPHLQNMR